jgi:peptide/nickel transport system substrate-binding protein
MVTAAIATFAPLAASAAHPWTQPGVLRIGVARDLDTLDPVLSGQAGLTDLAQLVFSGLIRYDDRGEAIPDAATAVPTRANHGISADGKTIVYHLRHNVRFSDGHPLTAEDVVFTWQQVLNPANNVPYHFPYDEATSVVAKDPYTVVVHLKHPSAPFVAIFMRCGTQGAIIPKHLLQGLHDLNTAPFNTQPVGSGPFKIVSYHAASGAVLVPNPYWFGGKPKLDRIDYKIIPTESSLQVAMETHEIDMYWGAAESQYRALKAIDGVRVDASPSYQYEEVVFNTRRTPFSDLTVRRAAASAINWAELARAVYLAVDLPGVTDSFPGSWSNEPALKHPPFDLAKARALLNADGWKPGPDGIRVKDGKRLTVEFSTVSGIITRANAEVLIQQELHDAGFDVAIHNANASLLFSAYGAGGLLATGKFDMAIYAWTKTPDPDDSDTLGPDRVPPKGANYTGLKDAEIGRLQTIGAENYERGPRKKAYVGIQQRIQELLPFQTMVWRANIDAYNDDLRNFRPAPAVSDFWNAGDWSI